MKSVAMKKYITLIAIITIAFNALGQNKQERKVGEFNEVHFKISGTLYLTQGNTFSVVIEGDEDTIEDIETRVSNDRLIVEWVRPNRWFNGFNGSVDVYVTMKEIEGLAVSGSGVLVGENKLTSDNLDLSVSGSGRINVGVDAKDLDISISGSGRIEVNGNSNYNELAISGSGRFEGLGLQASSYDVKISGSGTAKINVTEAINSKISGSGSIRYKGNPLKVRADVSGSGRVRKL